MASTPSPLSRKGWIEVDLASLAGHSGDPVAREAVWVRVYRHYGPRLESYFGARLGSRPELDAFLSDLWERALLNVRTLRSAQALWSWLTTIGNNLLRDGYRRGRVLDRREVLWTDVRGNSRIQALIAGWTGPVMESPQEDDPRRGVLDSLSQEELEFLALYAIDGLSHEEIAKRLELRSAGASRQRLRRLRLRLTGSDSDE